MTVDFTGQLDPVAPPSPLTAADFTSTTSWRASPAAAIISVTAEKAVAVAIDISAASFALPGSPLGINIVPGPADAGQSALIGAGVSTGEPAEWNEVRLQPQDQYGNVLDAGALDVADLSLQFTPGSAEVQAFEVRSLDKGRAPACACTRPSLHMHCKLGSNHVQAAIVMKRICNR